MKSLKLIEVMQAKPAPSTVCNPTETGTGPTLPTIYVSSTLTLPDNDQWQFRFQIESESSNRLYVIAQHKTKKHWGCSCPGWKKSRHCKHLKAMDLPGNEKPYEVNFQTDFQ